MIPRSLGSNRLALLRSSLDLLYEIRRRSRSMKNRFLEAASLIKSIKVSTWDGTSHRKNNYCRRGGGVNGGCKLLGHDARNIVESL